jgi:excisionase family DNA binding protein
MLAMPIEQHFTIADVAKALRLSTRTVQRMIEAGKLRAIDLAGGTGQKPLLRIPASELRRLGIKVTEDNDDPDPALAEYQHIKGQQRGGE